jgi:hypothetical protein
MPALRRAAFAAVVATFACSSLSSAYFILASLEPGVGVILLIGFAALIRHGRRLR